MTEGEDYLFNNPVETTHKFNSNALKGLKQAIEQEIGHKLILKVAEEDRLNAFATFNNKDQPVITLTRGLINHSNTTQDVIVLLICHEAGHFFGGYPKQMRGNSSKKSWSTAEGQADYYSIINCAKGVFKNRIKTKNQSQKKYPICEGNQNCNRLTEAALNLSKVYAEIKFWPYDLKIDRPDPTVVYETNLGHPNPQCRLDTMLKAILCSQKYETSRDNEAFYTCINESYKQPGCWLSPSTFQDI